MFSPRPRGISYNPVIQDSKLLGKLSRRHVVLLNKEPAIRVGNKLDPPLEFIYPFEIPALNQIRK